MVIEIILFLLAGTAIAATFWDSIREKVAEWLRSAGLQKTKLMSAWIRLDSIVAGVRCRIFVKTVDRKQHQVSEETYTQSQINDADVLAELKRLGHAKRDILQLIE
jgi:G3E family GTPase